MPDDTNDDHSDHEHVHGIGIPMPAGLLDMLTGGRKMHEAAHMEAERRTMTVDNFMESLSTDQLLALRYILNAGENPNSMSQFFDGQAYALLKWKHGVDPNNGEDPMAALLKNLNKGEEGTSDTDGTSDDTDGTDRSESDS